MPEGNDNQNVNTTRLDQLQTLMDQQDWKAAEPTETEIPIVDADRPLDGNQIHLQNKAEAEQSQQLYSADSTTQGETEKPPIDSPYAKYWWSDEEIAQHKAEQADRPESIGEVVGDRVSYAGKQYQDGKDFIREHYPNHAVIMDGLLHYGRQFGKAAGYAHTDLGNDILQWAGTDAPEDIKDLITDPKLGLERSLGAIATGVGAEIYMNRLLATPGLKMAKTPQQKALIMGVSAMAYGMADHLAAVDAGVPAEELRLRFVVSMLEEITGQKFSHRATKFANKKLAGFRDRHFMQEGFYPQDTVTSIMAESAATPENVKILNDIDRLLPIGPKGKYSKQRVPLGSPTPGALTPEDAGWITKVGAALESFLAGTKVGREAIQAKRKDVHFMTMTLMDEFAGKVYETLRPAEVGRLIAIMPKKLLKVSTAPYGKMRAMLDSLTAGGEVHVKDIWNTTNELFSGVSVDKGPAGETFIAQVRASLLDPEIFAKYQAGDVPFERAKGAIYDTDTMPASKALDLIETLKRYIRQHPKDSKGVLHAKKTLDVTEAALKSAYDRIDSETKGLGRPMGLWEMYKTMNKLYADAKGTYNSAFLKKIMAMGLTDSRADLPKAKKIFDATLDSVDIEEWSSFMDMLDMPDFKKQRAMYTRLYTDSLFAKSLQGAVDPELGFRKLDPSKMLETMLGTGIDSPIERGIIDLKGAKGYGKEISERILGKDGLKLFTDLSNIAKKDIAHWEQLINTPGFQQGRTFNFSKVKGALGGTATLAVAGGAFFAHQPILVAGGAMALSTFLLLNAPKVISRIWSSPGGQALIRRSAKVGWRSEVAGGLINKMAGLGEIISKDIRKVTGQSDYTDDTLVQVQRDELAQSRLSTAGISESMFARRGELENIERQIPFMSGALTGDASREGFLPKDVSDPLKKFGGGLLDEQRMMREASGFNQEARDYLGARFPGNSKIN
jgi:hypothetical protein